MSTPQLQLLLSGRVGYPIGLNRDGRQVFVGLDGKCLCRHGELASSIQSTIEKNKKRCGRLDIRPEAECGCINTVGLQRVVHEDDWPPPPASLSVFDLLPETTEKDAMGRRQRQAYPGSNTPYQNLWVTHSGGLVCQHGNSKAVIKSFRDPSKTVSLVGRVRCCCTITFPRRSNSVFKGGRAAIFKNPKKKATPPSLPTPAEPTGAAEPPTDLSGHETETETETQPGLPASHPSVDQIALCSRQPATPENEQPPPDAAEAPTDPVFRQMFKEPASPAILALTPPPDKSVITPYSDDDLLL